MGNANAGMAAEAGDASILFANPAALTRLKRAEATLGAVFVGITDCHHPDFWVLEQIPHFTQALGAAANVGHGNLIRGRNFAAAGDDMGWDDGDGRCDGSCRTDKFSPVDLIRLIHWGYVIEGQ